MRGALVLLAVLLVLGGCGAPGSGSKAPAPQALGPFDPTPDADAGKGGLPVGEENLSPSQLSSGNPHDAPDSTPGQTTDLDIRILDARGTGHLGSAPIPAGKVTAIPAGVWMLTDEDSEYEITLRSSLLSDGIVRLSGMAAFLAEPPLDGALPRLRVFGGKAAFYLPHVAPQQLEVLTPAGPLVTRGAVFTVTVSPDFQVLVTCREGAVYLTGTQNAVAVPGQVVVADRLGRGRVYAMTPNEATVFTDRWLKVMTEEAGPVIAATLPRRLAAWGHRTPWNLEDQRFTALWFREAKTVLPATVPGPDVWSAPLATKVEPSAWDILPPAPGLLGELP